MKTLDQRVVIINYGLGNLFSVKQACDTLGINAGISSEKKDLMRASAIILPGVGAFGEAMANLKRLDLIGPINDFVATGKPLFGICLGLQLLFAESEEFGANKGLGIIEGQVKRIPANFRDMVLRIPQVGWNAVHKNGKSWDGTPLSSVKDKEYFYFVHSFYVSPQSDTYKLGITDYHGFEYCSVAFNGSNIFATQFHPEKSGQSGLIIYRDWAISHNLILDEGHNAIKE